MSESVWVEVTPGGNAVTIYKSKWDALGREIGNNHLSRIPRDIAVGNIRHQVYLRQRGKCVKCDGNINEQTMHMDEILDRGKGGLISLENCQGLCADCHIGPRGKHGLTRGIRSGKVKT